MLLLLGGIFGGLAALGLGYWLGLRAAGHAASSAQAQASDRQAELERLRRDEAGLRERAARAEQAAEESGRRLAEDQQRLDRLRSEIALEAGRLLTEKSGELRAEASRHFEGVLAPLRQNLDDLKGLADRIHQQDSASRAGLAEQVRLLTESHRAFNEQAGTLSLSLKSNTRAQGAWGEVVLASVLEASGLREGQEYVLQGRGLKLKAEDGRSQLPDAVVLLPEGRQVVIDAKASLTSYFRWAEARSEAEQEAEALELVASLKRHIKGLGDKDYSQLEGLRSPEFTLMFVPLEPALGVALRRDPGLFQQSWERRIVVVGPNTLFSTLKMIDQVWGQERRNRNAEEIAKRGGLLYDKFHGFLKDFMAAKDAMKSALGLQEEAQRKLVDGRGSIVSQAEEMKRLGAKAAKQLPEAWVAAAADGPDEAANADAAPGERDGLTANEAPE
jgi:DNA recombination protein RmuC